MKLFSSCSSSGHEERPRSDYETQRSADVVGNPNPARFKILRSKRIGRFTVVSINYPDSTNYEGDKILVFEGISVATLKGLDSIDPHFCESKTHVSPVARFEPTPRGWRYATIFCGSA